MRQRWVMWLAAAVAAFAVACGGATGTNEEPEMLTDPETTPVSALP